MKPKFTFQKLPIIHEINCILAVIPGGFQASCYINLLFNWSNTSISHSYNRWIKRKDQICKDQYCKYTKYEIVIAL